MGFGDWKMSNAYGLRVDTPTDQKLRNAEICIDTLTQHLCGLLRVLEDQGLYKRCVIPLSALDVWWYKWNQAQLASKIQEQERYQEQKRRERILAKLTEEERDILGL